MSALCHLVLCVRVCVCVFLELFTRAVATQRAHAHAGVVAPHQTQLAGTAQHAEEAARAVS